MEKFIAYYRVSTTSQGESGLGLESQRTEVHKYVDSIGGTIIEEYTDIESGKNNNRENLWKAIESAGKQNAALIVKKFDRLSRGGLKMMGILEELGITYIESDSPHDDTLLKELKFSIAKDEIKKTSSRTKAALKIIKGKLEDGQQHVSKKGNVVTHLGNPDNLTDDARKNSVKSRRLKALLNKDNIKASALILSLRDGAKMSWYGITKSLNDAGFKTSQGNDFSEVQTKRIYELFKK